MKRTFVLAIALVFSISLLAPAFSYSQEAQKSEKKVEKKETTKATKVEKAEKKDAKVEKDEKVAEKDKKAEATACPKTCCDKKGTTEKK